MTIHANDILRIEERTDMDVAAVRYDRALNEITRSRIFLAPMSGITDVPFRLMARRHGARFAFTEMIDVNGIYYENLKTLRMMDSVSEDAPLAVQIVGQDEEKILFAAKVCEEKGFGLLDLNAGCPAHKVVKCGKGAALLKDPIKLGKIVRRLVKSLSIPVTVKMRSGWDDDNLNYLEVARAVASEGASALCVHSRTQKQMYKGKPDHAVIRAIKEKVFIPVFASGNVFSPRDVSDIFEATGCDAVSIARGALGHPWIFKDTHEFLDTGKLPEARGLTEIKQVITEHFSLCREFYPEERIFSRMYKNMCWYLKDFKGLNDIMRAYLGLAAFSDIQAFIERLSLDGPGKLTLARSVTAVTESEQDGRSWK